MDEYVKKQDIIDFYKNGFPTLDEGVHWSRNDIIQNLDNLNTYKVSQWIPVDYLRTEISKSKTEHELQLAERDIKGKLLVSHIYCAIVNIIDKYVAESKEKE